MADETLDTCLRLSTIEIKADIDTITKIKKYCCFIRVLCIVFPAENLYFEFQTNKQITLKLP